MLSRPSVWMREGQFNLGKLLASRTTSASLPDARLQGGVRLSGRCLGADDKPAAGATIYCISVSAETRTTQVMDSGILGRELRMHRASLNCGFRLT